jgi:probable phosphoglycerate mutase
MAGVELSSEGVDQARRLAARFARERIDVIVSSPQHRARQTAQPIAARLAIRLKISAEVDELDAGAWTGASFAQLATDPRWHAWNEKRAASRPPGGESMLELQTRVVRHLEGLRARGRDAVVVSHAEPIRAAILHYRAIDLDDYADIDVDPASISILDTHRDAAPVLAVNVPVPA